jgi:CDP-diglyceride synthetase
MFSKQRVLPYVSLVLAAVLAGIFPPVRIALTVLLAVSCTVEGIMMINPKYNKRLKSVDSSLIVFGLVYTAIMIFAAGEMSIASAFRFFLVLSVYIIHDTAAYLVGKPLRNTSARRIIPNISPNKTVRGALAGYVCGVLAGIVLTVIWGFASGVNRFSLSTIVIIVLGPLAAFAGDAVESLLKRRSHIDGAGDVVKENNVPLLSSLEKLLGEHGGVLDRADALLPIFVLGTVADLITRMIW